MPTSAFDIRAPHRIYAGLIKAALDQIWRERRPRIDDRGRFEGAWADALDAQCGHDHRDGVDRDLISGVVQLSGDPR